MTWGYLTNTGVTYHYSEDGENTLCGKTISDYQDGINPQVNIHCCRRCMKQLELKKYENI